MKIVFLVSNAVFTPRVMEMLNGIGIDYYTLWEQVKGKGHGTDPHLGTRSFPGMNAVLMIAFHEEAALEQLVRRISEANELITRADDRIRLFQLPLEQII